MLGVDRALTAPDAGRGPEPGNAREVTACGRGDSCEAGDDDTCAIKPFAGSAVDGMRPVLRSRVDAKGFMPSLVGPGLTGEVGVL